MPPSFLSDMFLHQTTAPMAPIRGIGVDMVYAHRMVSLLHTYSDKIVQRLLHPQEYSTWQATLTTAPLATQATQLAKYWASKEATVKALGTGFRQGIHWKQIYLSRNSLGKPHIDLSGKAAAYAQQQGIHDWHIALSDERVDDDFYTRLLHTCHKPRKHATDNHTNAPSPPPLHAHNLVIAFVIAHTAPP